MEHLRGSSFEGRRRALPCHAETRELRQVTPLEAFGVVGEASEINRLLQLRLRAGSPAGMDVCAFDEWDSYSRELTDEFIRCFSGAKSKFWSEATPDNRPAAELQLLGSNEIQWIGGRIKKRFTYPDGRVVEKWDDGEWFDVTDWSAEVTRTYTDDL